MSQRQKVNQCTVSSQIMNIAGWAINSTMIAREASIKMSILMKASILILNPNMNNMEIILSSKKGLVME